MSKFSFKGIIIGSILDIVVTSILQIPLMIYVISTLNLSNTPKDQVMQAVVSAMQSSYVLYAIGMTFGIIGSVFGGYMSALIAKHHEILNGAFASSLCVISGIYALFFGTMHASIWLHILGFVLSPALAAFGGYLRLIQVRRKVPNA